MARHSATEVPATGATSYDESSPAHGNDSAHAEARDKFGGLNIGAAFFGWLVAIAIAILLTSIVGAVLAGVGSQTTVTQSEAQRQAGTIGVAAGIVLLLVLVIGYYTGGYVAGRMSRFDGGRQGTGVWLIGLLVTIVAIGLGALFGSQYNILDRVSLPRIPVSTDQLGWGAAITAVAVVLLTLLAAMLGGKVGHRYHDRVDRAAGR
jgi:amino acid transporter